MDQSKNTKEGFLTAQLIYAQKPSNVKTAVISIVHYKMSHVTRGSVFFCQGENKGADQLHSYRITGRCLCFRYIDGADALLHKSEVPGF